MNITETKPARAKTAARDHVAEFIAYLVAQKSSKHTIRAYRRDVLDFFKNGISPRNVKRSDCIKYLSRISSKQANGKEYSGSTIRAKMGALGSFFRFMVEDLELLSRHPMRGLKLPEPVCKPKVLLTEEEVQKIFSLPIESYADRVDHLSLQLFYSTGGRLGDAENARLANVNLEDGTLYVIGKGNKPATLSLNQNTQAAIWDYILFHRPKTNNAFLLVTEDGQKWGSDRIYKGAIRAAKRAGIAKRAHPHAWRRSIGTHLLVRGQNIKSISNFYRHKNVATTNTYLEVGEREVRQDLARFHPLP